MPAGSELSLEIRGTILALYHEGFGWVAISEKLPNVSPDVARKLIKRVRGRTPPEEDIFRSYMYLKDLPRFGRPEIIAKDSWQSNALREAILQDEEHQDMTFSEVAQSLEL